MKETAFFLEHVTGDLSANAAAYIKYFTPMKPGSIALEGSAAYLGFADEVIPKVRSLLQNVKFIFMLREPVSRFNSYYQYSKSTFRIPANMSFLEFCRACSGDAAGEQLSGVDQYDRYALQVPAVMALQDRTAELQAFVAAGFGLADLTALFVFRPIERIHALMGDMSPVALALASFQTQVELRLIQMDASSRSSVGQAAEAVAEIAPTTIKLIQEYFEANPSA